MDTALVTGASRGLGLALVRSLAADGWRVVVDARDGGQLGQAVAGLGKQAVAGLGKQAVAGLGAQAVAGLGAQAVAGLGAQAVAGLAPHVVAVAGDVADPGHRAALADAVGERLDALVHNASVLGPSPQPLLADYPLDVLRHVYEVNVLAPIALTQLLLPRMPGGARIVAVTSDAAVEAYEGWAGYGSSKAALEHAFAVLGEERPDLRVYRVDPGDMNTRMQQEAFPGEDVSDRPPPAASVPGLRRLLAGDLPSGRYQARALAGVAA